MGITLSSTGGVTDPYNGEGAIPSNLQFPNAVYENTSFIDYISVDLNGDPSPYISINNVTVSVSLSGNTQPIGEITDEANLNDISYSTPLAQVSTLNSLVISKTIAVGNATANISISGNIEGAFTDTGIFYKTLNTQQLAQASSFSQVPTSNVSLYLFKPSFNRFNSVLFSVLVEYDSANITSVCEKRVLNDWQNNSDSLNTFIQQQGI